MRSADGPTVLYDWAHPQQQHFAKLTKLLRKRAGSDLRFRGYHGRLHMELAQRRRAIKDEISQALSANCTRFEFKKWQRTFRWKYCDHPLCTLGSLVAGGRFNIGKNIDPTTFPAFSAFYAADDKDTADREALGQDDPISGLKAVDLALAKPDSIVTISVSGLLEEVLDLRDPACLRDFVQLIKEFKVSPSLVREAKKLPVVPPRVITTSASLQSSLLNPNWRHVPFLCEIPANSQIFGQLVVQAGIEGIVYPSKLTDKPCIAIFPENFIGGLSFIEIDGAPPSTVIGPCRIDATNWEACERTAADLVGSPLRKPAA